MNQLNVSLQHSTMTLAAHGWSHRRIALELDNAGDAFKPLDAGELTLARPPILKRVSPNNLRGTECAGGPVAGQPDIPVDEYRREMMQRVLSEAHNFLLIGPPNTGKSVSCSPRDLPLPKRRLMSGGITSALVCKVIR